MQHAQLMMQQEVQQFVEYSVFVPVAIGMIGLILTAAWLLLVFFKGEVKGLHTRISSAKDEVSNIKARVSIIERQNEGDNDNIKDIWTRIEIMEKQRTTDVIQFTEALGKLNNTLGKIEITLENSNGVMQKIERRLEDQDKEISRLKYRDK